MKEGKIMYNNDLNSMFEDEENNKFEEWGKNEVAFFDDLDEKEKHQLKLNYDKNISKENIATISKKKL